jgi:hypothetical protein
MTAASRRSIEGRAQLGPSDLLREDPQGIFAAPHRHPARSATTLATPVSPMRRPSLSPLAPVASALFSRGLASGYATSALSQRACASARAQGTDAATGSGGVWSTRRRDRVARMTLEVDGQRVIGSHTSGGGRIEARIDGLLLGNWIQPTARGGFDVAADDQRTLASAAWQAGDGRQLDDFAPLALAPTPTRVHTDRSAKAERARGGWL